jgi:hypothetical protein
MTDDRRLVFRWQGAANGEQSIERPRDLCLLTLWQSGNLEVRTCRETSGAIEVASSQAVIVGEGRRSTDFASLVPGAMGGRPTPSMTSHSRRILGNDSVVSQQAPHRRASPPPIASP